jgi:eukaryotic-like serine/threonine-protein kinase
MPETVIAGRYRLDELLGRGGMSEVWAAEDLELGRRVAIKLLAPDADQARFEREARAVASLAHPNVTQLYDYGEEHGRPYMVLEYLPGGTLEDRLDGKPLPDDETSAIAAGVAAGLAHAHARGVVHRDLKPANVLFDEEGRPKLADFGIARMAVGEGTLTEAGTVLGTAAYISPEQASGEPASPASDVYSFGVILYRLLTGRLPFESKDPMQLVLMHRDVPPPPITSFREDVPVGLEATAAAALAKDPRDRPADGAALLRELGVPTVAGLTTAATAIAGAPTQVLPPAGPPPAPGYDAYPEAYPEPPTRRSRLPLVLALLAVLAIAGGALAYAITRPDSSPAVGTSTFTPITLHTRTHQATTAPTTTAASTTAPTTTAQTTTQATTTRPATTTAPPPLPTTTVAPPTTTVVPPTTTAPPPTTTADTVTLTTP